MKTEPNIFSLPRKGEMNAEVNLFFTAREQPDKEVLEHLRNASKLPTAMRVIGLPSLTTEQHAFPSGCIVATSDKIVPGIVGEDINAGTRTISTNVLSSDVHCRQIEDAIRKNVPFGKKSTNLKMHEGDFRLLLEFGVAGLDETTGKSGAFWTARDENEEQSDARKTEDSGSVLSNSSSLSHLAIERGMNQLGTAGGIGHFIDIQSVEGVFDARIGKELGLFKDQLLVTFNVGSRGFGHQVAEEYIKLARKLNGAKVRGPELSFLDAGSAEAELYLQAYACACNFAYVNRQIITALMRSAVRKFIGKKAMPLTCDIPHNTLRNEPHGQKTMWVHRKAAANVLSLEAMRPAKPGAVAVISGSPDGATYILSAGEKSHLTVNSLSVHTGGRSVDQIVRCLVDSGLARMIARLKTLTSIP